jgi:pantetheine-phosphate adenylyltransferase
MKLAIYPGSFDPLTNGHLDIIMRAGKLFDRVILAIANNENKTPMFSKEVRSRLARETLQEMEFVSVDTFDGLLVDYAYRQGATAIIRGLRAISDFEFEFQLALMNRHLNSAIETIFMMPKDKYTFLSSGMVKEVAALGGDIREFVPQPIFLAMQQAKDGMD